ncbi:amino acid permease [Carboxylicivirga sp. N1Y90]|uniref:amino acid permease n=1 Tax=Carboxylicivirga fragile TaxID=3417571 RepID=UPI003D34589A|nr:amino acid permease [Marinilabiliaceae bacterium N1Y90]
MSSTSTTKNKQGFGTSPVFFTAISTILGAILFLRFGYAIGTIGMFGGLLIIILGHLITIPTALAISEIATNTRVEGGGEYFIISRSFGLNIGATIGMALFMSQAISVAFYVIAFTETFEPLFEWWSRTYGWELPRQAISLPVMAGLALLILKKGANMGVKALYIVVVLLAISLIAFFVGTPSETEAAVIGNQNIGFFNRKEFFHVFAICFPAFTGMTAGVGLSGDLRDPGKSIPKGTMYATIAGMLFYLAVVYKLATSASQEDLLTHQLVMKNIAIGGFILIPLGLAASTISSALGSILVAPRTLQALATDKSFPARKVNHFLSRGKGAAKEPVNATIVAIAIAFVFVGLGNVNFVAEIISMFFMITYGSLCLISFLNHFGSAPSYRPRFRSKWYISLAGFLLSVWMMFQINAMYTIMAYAFITLLYIYINSYHKNRKGFEAIFKEAIFQLNRKLQVYMQQKRSKYEKNEWRPAALCLSTNSFERDKIFSLMNWISYKHGFGTYFHFIEGYFSRQTYLDAKSELDKLIHNQNDKDNSVYIDTMISPSYTTAIAQTIQSPSISGMENNMIIFEYDKHTPEELDRIVENINLTRAGDYDVCVFGQSNKAIKYRNGIHVWIKPTDHTNANLMILLGYIVLSHPDWRKGKIVIYSICPKEQMVESRNELRELVQTGRLPITLSNIEILPVEENIAVKTLINQYSSEAGLTIVGFREEQLKHSQMELFDGYEQTGDILFVNSKEKKEIS